MTVRLPSGASVNVRLLPSQEFDLGQRLGLRLQGDIVVFAREGSTSH